MATFQGLPFDIHFEVAQHLDFPSALALKKCNSYFYANIDLNRLPDPIKRAFLARAERFPQNSSLFACYKCDRMLPYDSFADKQRSGKRGKNASNPVKDRHCWDCAAEHRLCGHVQACRKGKGLFYLCWRCRRWGPRWKCCGIPNSSSKDSDSPDWVCWDDTPSPSIQGLPPDIQQRIFGLLGYRDSIALSQTSQLFHYIVDPRNCALHDKFRFTRDTAARMASEGHTACYGCFKVLPNQLRTGPSQEFTMVEVTMPSNMLGERLKRRCVSCAWRVWGGGPVAKKLLAEWRSRTMCEFCKLLKIRNTECLGCKEKEEQTENLE